VIAAARLRGGTANSARGAASLAAEAISVARQAGCTGAPLLTFLLALAGACLAWLLLGPAQRTERPPASRGQERPRALRRRALPALAFAAAAGLALAGRLLPVDQGIPGDPTATVAAIQGMSCMRGTCLTCGAPLPSRNITSRPRRTWPPRSGRAPGPRMTW